MVHAEVKIVNIYGIHCRPSAMIIAAMQNINSDIMVGVPERSLPPILIKSVLNLITIGAMHDETISISANGKDEEKDLEKMIDLFSTDYDFQR